MRLVIVLYLLVTLCQTESRTTSEHRHKERPKREVNANTKSVHFDGSKKKLTTRTHLVDDHHGHKEGDGHDYHTDQWDDNDGHPQHGHGSEHGTALTDPSYSDPTEIISNLVLEDSNGHNLLTSSGSRRRLNEVSDVHLTFTYSGSNVDVVVPRGSSPFGTGAKVRFGGANGAVTTYPAADFEIPYFAGNGVSVTYHNDELHITMVIGTKMVTLDKKAGENEIIARDVSVKTQAVCGSHDDHSHRRLGSSSSFSYNSLPRFVNNKNKNNKVSERTTSVATTWDNCYTRDDLMRTFSLGIAMGSALYGDGTYTNQYNNSVAVSFIQKVITDSNIIYENQLNIKLIAGDIYIQTVHDSDAPSWDQGSTCPMTINEQLAELASWSSRPSEQGLWQILDDCFLVQNPGGSGTIGLAYLGTLCHDTLNAGVNWVNGVNGADVWTTFAHEVGHNFNASHSFEDGQGSTGGIMDYGDGTLNGIYQFNTQYRKDEICSEIQSVIDGSCNKDNGFALASPGCGDGVITPSNGENCDCGSSQTTCTGCTNCQLPSDKECGPGYDTDCCTDGMFEDTGTNCGSISDGSRGICDLGFCVRGGPCFYDVWAQNNMDVSDSCGLDPNNDCAIKCVYNDVCSSIAYSGHTCGGSDALWNVLDGISCTLSSGNMGICDCGVCSTIPTTPNPTFAPTEQVITPTMAPTTKAPTEAPTKAPTEAPTPIPTWANPGTSYRSVTHKRSSHPLYTGLSSAAGSEVTGKVHAMIKQIAGYEDNDVTVINGGAEFLFEFKTLEDFFDGTYEYAIKVVVRASGTDAKNRLWINVKDATTFDFATLSSSTIGIALATKYRTNTSPSIGDTSIRLRVTLDFSPGKYDFKAKIMKRKNMHDPDKLGEGWGSWKSVNYFAQTLSIDSDVSCNWSLQYGCQSD